MWRPFNNACSVNAIRADALRRYCSIVLNLALAMFGPVSIPYVPPGALNLLERLKRLPEWRQVINGYPVYTELLQGAR